MNPAHLLLATALALASLSGCSDSAGKAKADLKTEAAGYRFEHFEREKLLFVHRPDGEKDGVQLADVKHVFLHRIKPHDAAPGKPKYWWQFFTGLRTVGAPYFAGEPGTVIAILAAELPGFDPAQAQRMAAEFEKGRVTYCQVWSSPAYLAETRAKKEDQCR